MKILIYHGPQSREMLDTVCDLLKKWPDVTYRDTARCVGSLVSLKPVFLGTVQIKTRILQTIVNIHNYESKQWDEKIKVSYAPLIIEAELELKFWLEYLVPNNKRKSWPDPPTWTAWSDASDMAVGGFVANLYHLKTILISKQQITGSWMHRLSIEVFVTVHSCKWT